MHNEYQIRVIDQPSQLAEPVTLAEVKQFCRIDADYDGEDDVLQELIASAREELENYLNVGLAVKTLEVQFACDYLELPLSPTGEILTVKHGDTELTTDDYKLSGLIFKAIIIGGSAASGTISWFYPIGQEYPFPNSWTNGVEAVNTVTYKAGYAPTDIPKGLKHLVLRLVDYYYVNRGSTVETLPEDIASQAFKYSRNVL